VKRDPRKLAVFQSADRLVIEVYAQTRPFPAEERFGLQSQLRRAAVSVASNIVEGSARRSLADYLHFLNLALASASEAAYLLELAGRLGYLDSPTADSLAERYRGLVRGLHKMITALEDRPEA